MSNETLDQFDKNLSTGLDDDEDITLDLEDDTDDTVEPSKTEEPSNLEDLIKDAQGLETKTSSPDNTEINQTKKK